MHAWDDGNIVIVRVTIVYVIQKPRGRGRAVVNAMRRSESKRSVSYLAQRMGAFNGALGGAGGGGGGSSGGGGGGGLIGGAGGRSVKEGGVSEGGRGGGNPLGEDPAGPAGSMADSLSSSDADSSDMSLDVGDAGRGIARLMPSSTSPPKTCKTSSPSSKSLPSSSIGIFSS